MPSSNVNRCPLAAVTKMPLGAGLMSQSEITYGVRGILGTVDSDNPLEKVVL